MYTQARIFHTGLSSRWHSISSETSRESMFFWLHLILFPVFEWKIDNLPELDAVAKYSPSMLKARWILPCEVNLCTRFIFSMGVVFLLNSTRHAGVSCSLVEIGDAVPLAAILSFQLTSAPCWSLSCLGNSFESSVSSNWSEVASSPSKGEWYEDTDSEERRGEGLSSVIRQVWAIPSWQQEVVWRSSCSSLAWLRSIKDWISSSI